MTAATSKAY